MAAINPNKALSRRYFHEIMNQANEAVAHEILSPDFVFTLPTHPEPFIGPDGFVGLVKMLHGAFPDFYIDPQDMVADGDWVATRWVGGGTHPGSGLLTIIESANIAAHHILRGEGRALPNWPEVPGAAAL